MILWLALVDVTIHVPLVVAVTAQDSVKEVAKVDVQEVVKVDAEAHADGEHAILLVTVVARKPLLGKVAAVHAEPIVQTLVVVVQALAKESVRVAPPLLHLDVLLAAMLVIMHVAQPAKMAVKVVVLELVLELVLVNVWAHVQEPVILVASLLLVFQNIENYH